MKVDEQFKCKDCDNYNQCKYYYNRRETSFICKEFQNQWGFIKEFEDIKAEIEGEKIDIDLDIGQETLYNNAINDVIKIINKRISEMKGE